MKRSQITYLAIIIALSVHAIIMAAAYAIKVKEEQKEEEYFVPIELMEILEEDFDVAPAMNGEEAKNLIANDQSERTSERVNYRKKSNAQLEKELMEKYKNLEQEVKDQLESDREMNAEPEEDRPEREELELTDYGWYKEASYEGPVLAKYSLTNRHHNDLKIPGYTCKTSGQVQIEITVDNQGRVVDTKLDPSGTNTSNECLITNAMEFAAKSVFNSSSKAAKRQKGTITYLFKKQ